MDQINQNINFALLGLQPNANKTEVHQAFYNLALIYHPDKNKNTQDRKFYYKINKAYKELMKNLPEIENEIDKQMTESQKSDHLDNNNKKFQVSKILLAQERDGEFFCQIPVTRDDFLFGNQSSIYQINFPLDIHCGLEHSRYFSLAIKKGWTEETKVVVPFLHHGNQKKLTFGFIN